jgi:hypothetical protein
LASASAFAPAAFSRPSSSALGVSIETSDIKNGMTVELEGEPYKILSFSIMKQARGAAKTTIRFKNLMKGNTLENTYISGKKLETAQIDKVAHVFTYEDGVSILLYIQNRRDRFLWKRKIFSHTHHYHHLSFLFFFINIIILFFFSRRKPFSS